MSHAARLRILVSLTLASAVACSGASPGDDASQSSDALTALSADEIVGDLGYGQTSAPVPYTQQPKYRAFRFQGHAGDAIDAWVRAPGADAKAWLLDAAFQNVTSNDDGAPGTLDSHLTTKLTKDGTYYVAFREKTLANTAFTVALLGTPAGGSAACDPEVTNCSAPVAPVTPADGTHPIVFCGGGVACASGVVSQPPDTELLEISSNQPGYDIPTELVFPSGTEPFVHLRNSSGALVDFSGNLTGGYLDRIDEITLHVGVPGTMKLKIGGGAPYHTFLVRLVRGPAQGPVDAKTTALLRGTLAEDGLPLMNVEVRFAADADENCVASSPHILRSIEECVGSTTCNTTPRTTVRVTRPDTGAVVNQYTVSNRQCASPSELSYLSWSSANQTLEYSSGMGTGVGLNVSGTPAGLTGWGWGVSRRGKMDLTFVGAY